MSLMMTPIIQLVFAQTVRPFFYPLPSPPALLPLPLSPLTPVHEFNYSSLPFLVGRAALIVKDYKGIYQRLHTKVIAPVLWSSLLEREGGGEDALQLYSKD